MSSKATPLALERERERERTVAGVIDQWTGENLVGGVPFRSGEQVNLPFSRFVAEFITVDLR